MTTMNGFLTSGENASWYSVGICNPSRRKIHHLDKKIMAVHQANELSQRLEGIPGVGPKIATALVASIADPKSFKSGRQMAAWIGLVPKQNSSGGKEKLWRHYEGWRSISAFVADDRFIVRNQAGQETWVNETALVGRAC